MFGWKQSETKQSKAVEATEHINGGSPSDAAIVKPSEWQSPTFRHVDRLDCAETFADSITGVFFDGQTLRIDFAVSRMDAARPGAPLTGYRIPACRLVLPPSAAYDLAQKMHQVGAALAKAGSVRTGPPSTNS